MIKVENMSFSYPFGTVFDAVSFSVGKGFTAGLVGPNGAGKSTLLKLLLGEEFSGSGKVEVTGSIGYVPQEIKHDPVMEQSGSVKEYIDPEEKKDDLELYSMMQGLELDVALIEKPQHLSGGQKTKLAILRALVMEPAILLLDEPTNFLDIAGKKWLMTFLQTYPHTLLMISHDLPLLDASINKVIAINPLNKKIEEYKGNYSTFVKLQKEHEALLKRKIINEQKHIKQMELGLQRMARYTSKKGVRQRTVLKRRVEKLKANLPELPKEIRSITVSLPEVTSTGEIPIKAEHITKIYADEMILADVSLTVYRNERVAIIGPNGVGKSTFIKTILGQVVPDAGEVTIDNSVSIGYYSQEFETFDFAKTVLETAEEQGDLRTDKIRPFLAKFNFTNSRLKQKISTLSGGEKTRLSIALLMMKSNNVLILDEPTTYLDVLSQRVILEALKEYKGAMIFVSHTEEFVSELRPNRVLLLPENKVTYWIPELTRQVANV
jgi:ATP-binding cassette, subfamily F, member 3